MNRRHAHRSLAIAGTALAAGLTACGSSTSPTGPTSPTPAQLASFFDSIYGARIAAGTHADSEVAQYVAEYLELDPAFGASRSTITVLTSSGTEIWYGFTDAEYVFGDTSVLTVAYSDNRLTNVLIAEEDFGGSTPTSSVALFTDGFAIRAPDPVASVIATWSPVGSACARQSGLADSSYYQGLATYYTCQPATFTVSVSATFPTAANLGPLQIAFTNVGFSGIVFTSIDDPQHVEPGPTRVAGLRARLHARLHARLRALRA